MPRGTPSIISKVGKSGMTDAPGDVPAVPGAAFHRLPFICLVLVFFHIHFYGRGEQLGRTDTVQIVRGGEKNGNSDKGILFRQHQRVGPISARSPGTLLQDGILLMADKLNKCRSTLAAFGSLCLVLFLEKKLKAGH